MICMKVVKTVYPKSSYPKEHLFIFFLSIEMIDVNKTYCDNYFAIYIIKAPCYTPENHIVMYVNDSTKLGKF